MPATETETATATATDLLIIGGGPAGLGAATTFARTLRPWVLYDSGTYRNGGVGSSHTIMAYDGRGPAEWRADARRDLAAYSRRDGEERGGEVRDARVVSLRRVQGGGLGDPRPTIFEATDDAGRVTRARKVVLATGVRDVLLDIPGLAPYWGTRAIHCLFCHGAETAGSVVGFLLSRSAAVNAALVHTVLTVWAAVPHSKRYILTNGVGEDDPTAALRPYRAVLAARGFEIVTERITGIADSSSSSPLSLSLASLSLDIDYLVLVPSIEASPHARPLLTPALLSHADLGPMGALPGPPPDAHPAHMPARAGSDPRTPTRGLFWAGNAGAAGANTTMAAAQGQLAGVVAAGEVAAEDLESELGAVQG